MPVSVLSTWHVLVVNVCPTSNHHETVCVSFCHLKGCVTTPSCAIDFQLYQILLTAECQQRLKTMFVYQDRNYYLTMSRWTTPVTILLCLLVGIVGDQE